MTEVLENALLGPTTDARARNEGCGVSASVARRPGRRRVMSGTAFVSRRSTTAPASRGAARQRITWGRPMVSAVRRGSARFGQPFDGLGYSIGAGFRLLPLVDPPCVLVAVREGQLLVRGLGCWVVSERLGELSRLHDDSLLMVLNEFNLDQLADCHIKLPERSLAEAR